MGFFVGAIMYPTREKLESLFFLDRLTGELLPISKGVKAPRENDEGYLVITVDGYPYLAHRCIWIMVTGECPKGLIDHRDGRRSSNFMPNLRLATNSQNSMNKRKDSRNTSGHKGVSWESREGKWKAEIRKGKKRVFRKFFERIEDAAIAVRIEREEIHGEFARHE